jgi:hypothetical protein
MSEEDWSVACLRRNNDFGFKLRDRAKITEQVVADAGKALQRVGEGEGSGSD